MRRKNERDKKDAVVRQRYPAPKAKQWDWEVFEKELKKEEWYGYRDED